MHAIYFQFSVQPIYQIGIDCINFSFGFLITGDTGLFLIFLFWKKNDGSNPLS